MHPVHRFSGRLTAVLDGLVDASMWSMTPDEQAQTLVELTRTVSRLAELRLRVFAAADRADLGATYGAASTASWLASSTQQERARAHGDLRLARTLDDPAYTPTREALATGAVNLAQAWVIVRALEELHADRVADDITADQWDTAQARLVDLARDHDAKALRILARRIFELLAPAEADKREGEALEREERRARRKTSFAMRENGDGTTSGWFTIPTVQGEMLTKVLNAYAAPRRTSPEAWTDTQGKKVPYRTLLGHAFCELIEHLPTEKLPQAGGVAATIVVTVPLEKLTDGVGAARWTPERGCPPARPADSPAPPESSPWSSTATPHPWTSAGRAASTTATNASPWPTATAAAPPTAVTGPRPGAKHITTGRPGPRAAEPTSPRDACSVHGTTTWPTTPPTTPDDSPTAHSDSPDVHDAKRASRHGRSDGPSGDDSGQGHRGVSGKVEIGRTPASPDELTAEGGDHRAVVGAQARPRHAHPDAVLGRALLGEHPEP